MNILTINPNTAQVPNTAPVMLSASSHQLLRQTEFLRYAKVQLDGEVAVLLYPQREDIEAEFSELVRQWKSARRAKFLVFTLAMHPAYQKIIGMGKPAIRLILSELNREVDHWFWALETISREDPVPESSKGNMEEMARIWTQWGREHGYVG